MNSFTLSAVGNLARDPELIAKRDLTYTRFCLVGNDYAGKDEQGAAREVVTSLWFVAFGANQYLTRDVLRFVGDFSHKPSLAFRPCRDTMTLVPADAFINCRVDCETKALVRNLADRQGITESRLVKDLLAAMLRNAAVTRASAPPAERLHRDARVYVRLTSEDLQLLTERAQARHMPLATYVSLLLRTHLHRLAPLPQAEYAALKSSVAELSAIGRNLNQIARIMHQGGTPAAPGRLEVAAMREVAAGLRSH